MTEDAGTKKSILQIIPERRAEKLAGSGVQLHPERRLRKIISDL